MSLILRHRNASSTRPDKERAPFPHLQPWTTAASVHVQVREVAATHSAAKIALNWRLGRPLLEGKGKGAQQQNPNLGSRVTLTSTTPPSILHESTFTAPRLQFTTELARVPGPGVRREAEVTKPQRCLVW